MKTSPLAPAGAVLIVCLWSSGAAHADPIVWSYDWSRTPSKIFSDNGQSWITLTDESPKSVVGDSALVATNLDTFSTAPRSDPDTFTDKEYTLNLHLLDQASGQDGTLHFAGRLDGTLSADSANIANTFLGQTTQQITLGSNLYTVVLNSYAAPGPPGAVNPGAISAMATVTVAPITIATLPEPGSLALAGLGAAGLGLAAWRRRRRAPAPPRPA
jgi:type 1 fimbria pilin